MTSRPQQIHGVRVRDGLDKAFLAIAFVAGAVGILWLKQLDIEPWWAALFSAGVLVSYAIAAWANRYLALEPEVIGDNSYYLGFIFTLISLGATLYQMGGTGTDSGALRDVIAGFGVALSSTIIGVFLRVFMMQLRIDIVARDRHARLELNDASREFRSHLVESVSQMKAFTTEALQLAGETHARIHKDNETFHREQRELMARTSEEYTKALTDLMAASSSIITRDLKASIDEVLTELRSEVSESLDYLRAVTAATAKLQEDEAAEQARRLSVTVAEAKQGHDTLTALNALLQKVSRNATKVSEAVESAADTISGGVTRAVADVEAAARQAEAILSLRSLGSALDQPIAALEAAAARIEAVSREVERQASAQAAPFPNRMIESGATATQEGTGGSMPGPAAPIITETERR